MFDTKKGEKKNTTIDKVTYNYAVKACVFIDRYPRVTSKSLHAGPYRSSLGGMTGMQH